MAYVTKRCTNEYLDRREDTTSYSPGWNQQLFRERRSAGAASLDGAFTYSSEEVLKTLPHWAKRHVYPSGGYVLNLGNSLADAENAVRAAREHNWIDEYTRAVFAEFNIWNANTNLFNMVIIVFEYETSGLVTSSHTIDVIDLYRYNGAGGIVHLLAETLLLIFIIVKTILELVVIVRTRGGHLLNLAHFSLFLVLVLYYTACGLYIYRSLLTVETVEDVINNRGNITIFCNAYTYRRNCTCVICSKRACR